MSDEQSRWKIDLDNKDFLKGSKESLASIQQIGDSKNLLGLISGFAKANIGLSLISAGMVALKATMDTVFAAEDIKAVNNQFEILTKNAGIAGASLKSGLEKASGGLIDNTELLQIANKSIVEMGDNASKLPEIMELARKSTAVMGGDLKNNFERLSHAVALGNTRMLKQMGIVIDADAAHKKLAASLGVSVSELSDAGKKQAILNEALEKGKTAFKGVDENAKQATNTYQKLKVSLGDIGETLILLFDKIVGPTVKKTLDIIASQAHSVALSFKSWWGDAGEKSAAKIELVEQRIIQLEKSAAKIKEGGLFDEKESIRQLGFINAELEKLKEKKDKLSTPSPTREKLDMMKGPDDTSKKETEEDLVDKEKSLERQRKFEADLLALKKTRMEDEKNNLAELGEDDWRLKQEQAERKHMVDIEFDLKRRELAEKYKNDEQMQRDLEVELEANHQAKLVEIDEQASQRKIDILNKQTEKSKTAADGIKNAFKAGAEENRKDLTNWGKTGKMVFGTFSKHSKQALLDFGAGTKTASEAMKGFMFGGIADIAEAKGMELLLSSIWPPNPVGLAAGGGLVALAGMLRAQAGGGGGSGGVGSAGGGAAGEGSSSGSTSSVEGSRPAEAEIQNKKSVTLQVMGNLFESEQGNRRLVEMVREASDATDFTVKQIGQV